MKRHPVVWAVVVLVIVAATSFTLNYRLENEKESRRIALCRQDTRQWQTLHDLVAETAKPGPQGTAIDHLVIPPDTPPSVLEILRQLNTANTGTRDLDRFYRVLGPKPRC